MAAVSIPHHDPWIVARWAFRRLLERAATLSGEEDKSALEQAVALDGLHFDLLEGEQARRVALAVQAAADQLRLDLLAGDQTDPRDAEFAEALAVLEMRLHDVYE
jgi:hypothetical protein